MSITYDNSAKISSGGNYTVGAGTLPFLLCMVINDSNIVPSGVTYGTTPMTFSYSLPGPNGGPGSPGIYIFTLPNPTTGTSLSVTQSGGFGDSVFAVFSYHGVGSVYPVFQHTQAEGDGNPTQLFITPDTSDSWVVSCGQNFSGTAPTVTGTGLTARQTSSTGSTGGSFWYDTNAAPNSLYTTTFSTTNLQYYTYASFLLSPTVPPPPPVANSASFITNFM